MERDETAEMATPARLPKMSRSKHGAVSSGRHALLAPIDASRGTTILNVVPRLAFEIHPSAEGMDHDMVDDAIEACRSRPDDLAVTK
jgi:hypothetical protein